MKKTRSGAIAAAALMTVFMLSGCGNDAGTITKTADAGNNVTSAAEPAAPAPEAAESQEASSAAEGAADSAAEGENKDAQVKQQAAKGDAAPADTKAPETKVPEAQPAAAAKTKALGKVCHEKETVLTTPVQKTSSAC